MSVDIRLADDRYGRSLTAGGGPVANRRAETARESREILIRAATELFAEKGFRRTTFVDVAERSGISRGSIPWHFSNKDGLLQAVIDQAVGAILDEATAEPMGAILDEATAEPMGLEAVLTAALRIVRRPSSRLFVTLIAEAVEPGSPIRDHYAQLQAALRAGLRAQIGTVDLPQGITDEDFVTVLLGAVNGINQQWAVAPGDIDLDRAFAALSLMATVTVNRAR
jgi:TetR/AcrR family acrAB operon transcriptional repressor